VGEKFFLKIFTVELKAGREKNSIGVENTYCDDSCSLFCLECKNSSTRAGGRRERREGRGERGEGRGKHVPSTPAWNLGWYVNLHNSGPMKL